MKNQELENIKVLEDMIQQLEVMKDKLYDVKFNHYKVDSVHSRSVDRVNSLQEILADTIGSYNREQKL